MSVAAERMNARTVVCAIVFVTCAADSARASTSGDSAFRATADRDYAIAVYFGRHTDSSWRDSITGQAGLVRANLAAVALSHTFRRAEDRSWSLELEGNTARQFGDQSNWEFNALVSARWHRFPWRDKLATSAAFGVGPSYAMQRPRVEVRRHGSSRRLLAFWQVELTAGPPGGDWEALVRLHHRSPAFGLLANDGGSNALTGGVRFRF